MRYIAILVDSFRQALDSKVLYFTFVLSFVTILIIASISYKPMSVKDQAQEVADYFNMAFELQAQSDMSGDYPVFKVKDFKVTKEWGDNPWEKNYHFKFATYFPKDSKTHKRDNQLEMVAYMLLDKNFWWMKKQQVALKTETTEEVGADGKPFTKRWSVWEFRNDGSKVNDRSGWKHEPSFFFGLLPSSSLPWRVFLTTRLGYSVYYIEYYIINYIGVWAITIISIVVTAGFIPNMLQKGSVDLLLSKPLTRTWLLVCKYLGGLTFVFLNSVFIIAGVWIVVGLRTGIWTYSFPLTALVITFFYGVLYSVSVLMAVLTRSTLVSIMITIVVWLILFVIGFAHGAIHTPPGSEGPMPVEEAINKKKDSSQSEREDHAPDHWLVHTVDWFHFLLPRTNDLGYLTKKLLSEELLSEEERDTPEFRQIPNVNWAESLIVSGVFIAVMLGLASWRFSVQDF